MLLLCLTLEEVYAFVRSNVPQRAAQIWRKASSCNSEPHQFFFSQSVLDSVWAVYLRATLGWMPKWQTSSVIVAAAVVVPMCSGAVQNLAAITRRIFVRSYSKLRFHEIGCIGKYTQIRPRNTEHTRIHPQLHTTFSFKSCDSIFLNFSNTFIVSLYDSTVSSSFF